MLFSYPSRLPDSEILKFMQAVWFKPDEAWEFVQAGFNLKREKLPPVMSENTSYLLVSPSPSYSITERPWIRICAWERQTLQTSDSHLTRQAKASQERLGQGKVHRWDGVCKHSSLWLHHQVLLDPWKDRELDFHTWCWRHGDHRCGSQRNETDHDATGKHL